MSNGALPAFPVHEFSDMEVEQAVNAIVSHAADVEASDLFIHTDERSAEVAIRRLGTVETLAKVSKQQGRQLISFVKVMADMNISEHRRPMDGRWILEMDERRLDIRINSIATLFGEDMTMRIWDRNIGLRKIETLGFFPQDMVKVTSMLTNPSGLMLVTGPTGTGKTTTLYACLEHLNDGTRKINTLEDPVEYALQGVRQSQINPKIGIDFPELLRNVLRQAPNVIMVGEIRDPETATTAVRAANSGHLVLATLHAPTAAGAVQSMLALGAHSYFLSSCLLGVVAQRLVRTLCPKCRVEYDISEAPETFAPIRNLLGPNEGKSIFGPSGCEACHGVGYNARRGLFEVMTMKQSIRKLIAASSTSEEIEKESVANGMLQFRRAAMLLMARGDSSAEEILRDVPAEHLGVDS